MRSIIVHVIGDDCDTLIQSLFEFFPNGFNLEPNGAERIVIETPASIKDEGRLGHRFVHTLVVVPSGVMELGYQNIQ